MVPSLIYKFSPLKRRLPGFFDEQGLKFGKVIFIFGLINRKRIINDRNDKVKFHSLLGGVGLNSRTIYFGAIQSWILEFLFLLYRRSEGCSAGKPLFFYNSAIKSENCPFRFLKLSHPFHLSELKRIENCSI